MKYLFELSKEHKTLPLSEILACLQAEKIIFNVLESNEDVLIIEINSKKDIMQRLASRISFSYYIDKFLFSCLPSNEDIKIRSSKNILENFGSIVIRYKNRSSKIDSLPAQEGNTRWHAFGAFL